MQDDPSINPPVLRMRGIGMDFGAVRALDTVDFDVRTGEVHALIGENGAGKSTLMNVLAGRFDNYAGQIEIGGIAVRLTNPRRALHQGVAVIYQELSILPNLTVAENIMLGQEPGGVIPGTLNHRAIRDGARKTLEQLGFDLPLDERVENLSTARQVLVEVARAMRRNPSIIVFDEPTAALGPEDVARLFDAIRELKSRGLGIVYISHRLAELPKIADRVTVLRDGRAVGTRTMDDCRISDLTRMMLGRELAEVFPRHISVHGGKRILHVHKLSREGAFANISFDLHEGEILGLAGLVGSGRTEIARALIGADPSSGAVILRDGELKNRTPRSCRLAGMCMVPEDRKRDGNLTGRPISENVNAGVLERLSTWLGYLPRSATRNNAARLIERLHVDPPDPTIEIQQLSGGNQQKVIVGRAVAAKPSVVIFDEPTQGIDVGTKAEMYRLIAGLAEAGRGIILISSELIELSRLCDRILVIRNGRVRDELRGGMDEEALLAACVGENH